MTWGAWAAIAALVLVVALWVFLGRGSARHRKGVGAEAQRPVAHLTTLPAPHVQGPWAPTRVELCLVRNPSFRHGVEQTEPRYFYRVRVNGTLLEARLPVFWDPRPASLDPLMREAYRVRVAGQLVEAGNLYMLTERVRARLHRLLVSGQPPQFWLVNGIRAIPVYRHGGAYKAVTDGRSLWAWDLAALRSQYAEYLASRNSGRCGPVAVKRFSLADLDVHAPAAVLVGPELWIPAFAAGERLMAFGPAEATWSVPQGPAGVLHLWEVVARELASSGRLPAPSALWLTELSDACRGGLLQASEGTGLVLRFTRFTAQGARRVSLPVRRLRHLYFAGCGEDVCLHVAPDLATLRDSVFRHLAELGTVGGIGELAAEAEAGPSAFAGDRQRLREGRAS